MINNNKYSKPVLIIGAGPAGLTAAHELMKKGIPSIVIEKSSTVGGLSQTVKYKGYHFDVLFQELPTQGALLGFILGILGLLSALFIK